MKVYAKFNDTRLEKFQIVTTIEKEGDKLVVYKYPASRASAAFFKSIFDKYTLLKKANLPFIISEPVKRDLGVILSYSQTRSLDTILYEAVLRRDKKDVLATFKLYKKFIDSIKTKSLKPSKEFTAVFGETVSQNEDCIPVGSMDLILENILEDKGKYEVIDYEWTFGFPVPIRYVAFRAVLNAFSKYSAYNISEFCKIEEVFKIFGLKETEIEQFLKYEYNFQKYVHGSNNLSSFDGYREEFNKIGLSEKSFYLEKIFEENKRLKEENNEKNLKEEKIKELEEKITNMKKSRFWKAREVAVKVRRKINGK